MPPAERRRFGRRFRVVNTGEFRHALDRGARASDSRLRVWVMPNGLDRTRLGLVVGRRLGPAVQRNRLKRILREAFRLIRAGLPVGFDVICSPQARVELELAGVQESIQLLMAAAQKRLRPRS